MYMSVIKVDVPISAIDFSKKHDDRVYVKIPYPSAYDGVGRVQLSINEFNARNKQYARINDLSHLQFEQDEYSFYYRDFDKNMKRIKLSIDDILVYCKTNDAYRVYENVYNDAGSVDIKSAIFNSYECLVLDDKNIYNVIASVLNETGIFHLYSLVGFIYATGLIQMMQFVEQIPYLTFVDGNFRRSTNERDVDVERLMYDYSLKYPHVNFYHYSEKFFHGKVFYMVCENEDYDYAIVGSSNISYHAFRANKEFNVLFRLPKDNSLKNFVSSFMQECELCF